jgi:branched-chain amino acid transport system permease protein
MADRFTVERSTRAGRIGAVLALVVIAALIAMPWWGGRGAMRTLIEFFYYLALAQMWNLLAGYGGLVSVGQQAYLGLGGYALLVLSVNLAINPFIAVLLAGVVAALFAVPTAALVFRLQGAYFAIGTWVVAEVYRLAIANTTWLGGGSGTSLTAAVKGIPVATREALTFWLALAIGVGSIGLVYGLLRSRFGLALTALRDSEPASESLGVRTLRVKLWVYIVAALGTGMTGALIYLTKLRISPDAAFAVDWTAFMIFIVIIGGIGTIEGPLIGTLLFFLLRELLSDLGSWYMIILGTIAVLVMLLARQGLWGWVAERFDLHLFAVQRRLADISTR